MQFIKMVNFQLKLYVKNSYFFNLLIIETSTILLYEYLAHYINQNYTGKEWLIASVMGTWASCTTSAGALGYQRWQGVLPHLLNPAISRTKTLLAILAPAVIYGLMSFPLAEIEALILQIPIKGIGFKLFLGILLFGLAATILSYFISLFFILSQNAIAYEQLILLPVLLLSGMLTIPPQIRSIIQPLQFLSPLSLPIRLIYQLPIDFKWIISYCLNIVIFTLFAKVMSHLVINRAFKKGRLEIF